MASGTMQRPAPSCTSFFSVSLSGNMKIAMPVVTIRVMFVTSAIGIAMSKMMTFSHHSRSLIKTSAMESARKIVVMRSPLHCSMMSIRLVPRLMEFPSWKAAKPRIFKTQVLACVAKRCIGTKSCVVAVCGSGNMKRSRNETGPAHRSIDVPPTSRIRPVNAITNVYMSPVSNDDIKIRAAEANRMIAKPYQRSLSVEGRSGWRRI